MLSERSFPTSKKKHPQNKTLEKKISSLFFFLKRGFIFLMFDMDFFVRNFFLFFNRKKSMKTKQFHSFPFFSFTHFFFLSFVFFPFSPFLISPSYFFLFSYSTPPPPFLPFWGKKRERENEEKKEREVGSVLRRKREEKKNNRKERFSVNFCCFFSLQGLVGQRER